MDLWVVIASGQSLNRAQTQRIQTARNDGRVQGVIAVNNVGLDMAPWADALVAHDARWWQEYSDARRFKGRKFCRRDDVDGVEQFIPAAPLNNGCNSGYMGCEVAWRVFGAKMILLVGFDMRGAHYFGQHEGIPNPSDPCDPENPLSPPKFTKYIDEFKLWRGCPIINCTEGSALTCFPRLALGDVLQA